MIDYISGRIAGLSPTQITIDNQGIGYCMEISLQTYAALDGKAEAKVFIQQQANPREGTTIEYGFATVSERELFRQITSVSGMGSSSARMILSALSPDELRSAILAEDINTLKSIKGIGLKSAQRMILELKDKVIKGDGGESDTLFKATASSETVEEATSALQMLGFSKPNIHKAIQSIMKNKPSATVEEIIKTALQML